jgi:hypothetical protein
VCCRPGVATGHGCVHVVHTQSRQTAVALQLRQQFPAVAHTRLLPTHRASEFACSVMGHLNTSLPWMGSVWLNVPGADQVKPGLKWLYEYHELLPQHAARSCECHLVFWGLCKGALQSLQALGDTSTAPRIDSSCHKQPQEHILNTLQVNTRPCTAYAGCQLAGRSDLRMAVLQRAQGLHGVCSAASARSLRPVASYARAPRRFQLAVHAVAQPQRDSTAAEPRVVSQTPEASSSGRTPAPLEQLRSWLSRSETRALSFVTAAAGAGILGSGFDLQGPGSVLQAIGCLAAIITVHECGHFAAARLQGIYVTQFAIGFGPPLFQYKVGRGCAGLTSLSYLQRSLGLQPCSSSMQQQLGCRPQLSSGAFRKRHPHGGSRWSHGPQTTGANSTHMWCLGAADVVSCSIDKGQQQLGSLCWHSGEGQQYQQLVTGAGAVWSRCMDSQPLHASMADDEHTCLLVGVYRLACLLAKPAAGLLPALLPQHHSSCLITVTSADRYRYRLPNT